MKATFYFVTCQVAPRSCVASVVVVLQVKRQFLATLPLAGLKKERRQGLCGASARVLGGRINAYYKGFGARKFSHKHRRLLRWTDFKRLRTPQSLSQQGRICTRKVPPQTAPKTSGVTAKNRMHKFHGIDGNLLFLAALPLGHLKECEFGYYNRNENLTKVIKKLWEKHKKN